MDYDDPTEAYRRRKMMQAMLEKGATNAAPADNAGPPSVLQPIGQALNGVAAGYNQMQMDAEKMGSAPAAGMTGPPVDPDLLKKLMAQFSMGGG